MNRLLLTLLVCSVFSNVAAKNYYLSEDGDDSNDGLSRETAWHTLEKLNSSMDLFGQGDSVLFRGGDTFRGTLTVSCNGSEDSPVVFASYGKGAKPVIDGTLEITQWINETGNIWSSTPSLFPGEIKNLFVDGERQPISRHPNSGFFFTSDPEGKTIFHNSEMGGFPENYWEGADITLRTASWIIDVLPIKSVTGSRVEVGKDATYNILSGYGFFIQNHLNAMDQEGEWAYTDDGRILLYTTQFDPNDVRITIPVVENGIILENADYIEVRDLEVSYHKDCGVVIENADYLHIKETRVLFCGVDAMRSRNSKGLLIENNEFSEAGNNGIDIGYTSNSAFVGNTVSKIGAVAGIGLNGNQKYTGILIQHSDDIRIQNNKVDSIGYNGIGFFTSKDISIRNNSVSYTCLVKDDGGGIYTWENKLSGNEIIGNIITHAVGASEAVPSGKKGTKAQGIYIDDRSKDLIVSGNTSAYNQYYGIYIHNAATVTITDNVMVDNAHQLGFVCGEDYPGSVVHNNIFVCMEDIQLCVRMFGNYNYEENFPEFNANRYYKFTSAKIAYQNYTVDGEKYSNYPGFEKWQEISGDENMTGFPVDYNDSISREEFLLFEYNDSRTEKSIHLSHLYRNHNYEIVTGDLAIPPYTSVVLVLDPMVETVEH